MDTLLVAKRKATKHTRFGKIAVIANIKNTNHDFNIKKIKN